MSRSPGASDYPTDISLLRRLNAPGTTIRSSAWEQFRKFYAPIIAGFARNMGAKQQDIDDVIQDVMLGFFAASPTFVYDPAKGRFRGYLKACTFRALQKIVGHGARFKSTPLQDVDPDSLELDQAWQENWEREQLGIAMKQLKEEFPTSRKLRAFEMLVNDGKSVQEVAKELKISEAAVYKAKQRTTEALKEKIQLLESGAGFV